MNLDMGEIPQCSDTTASAMAGKAFCLMKLKKYKEAYRVLTGLTGHYENGNKNNLPKEFVASCYNLSAICIIQDH